MVWHRNNIPVVKWSSLSQLIFFSYLYSIVRFSPNKLLDNFEKVSEIYTTNWKKKFVVIDGDFNSGMRVSSLPHVTFHWKRKGVLASPALDMRLFDSGCSWTKLIAHSFFLQELDIGFVSWSRRDVVYRHRVDVVYWLLTRCRYSWSGMRMLWLYRFWWCFVPLLPARACPVRFSIPSI